MENEVLNFLKKYWLCILLSVIMVVGIALSTCFADLYQTGSPGDMIRFNLGGLYIIYGLPLYSLIYGCLSYIKTKKIWFPQLILFIFSIVYWQMFDSSSLEWVGVFLLSIYPFVFSLIGTVITAFIFYVGRKLKEIWAD